MSGVLWDALPEGWVVGQVKNAASVTLGKMLQNSDSGNDTRAPYLRAANVQPDGVLALDDVNEMWFGRAELRQLNLRRGDVVVVEGGQGGFGRAAFVTQDLDGWGFQNSINRLRPVGATDGRFVAYYLIALRASGFIRAYCNIVSMPHLTAEKLARIPVPLPSPLEQTVIADYLDRETAQIDTLIAKQEQLIETLRERREAAVTFTMDGGGYARRPTPSDWYPHLPDDWTLGRVKSVSQRVTDGAHISPDTNGGVYEFVSTRDLHHGSIDFAGALRTSPETYEYMVRTGCQPRAGDVLYSKDGTVGETAVITENREFVVASSLVIISPNPSLMLPEFMAYLFSSSSAREQAASLMRGAGLPRLSVANLAGVHLPIPPLADQERVVIALDSTTQRIDALIRKAEQFIVLATERRRALITAAVTGQIDVMKAA